MSKPKPVDTIAIRNPSISELVAEQQAAGVGRSAVETAENLIRDGIEFRREKKSPRQTIKRPAPVTA